MSVNEYPKNDYLLDKTTQFTTFWYPIFQGKNTMKEVAQN